MGELGDVIGSTRIEERNSAYNAFLQTLYRVPWLKHLGKSSPRDHEVLRIFSWDMWPGPEHRDSGLQEAYHAMWYDGVFGQGAFQANSRDAQWVVIHSTVIGLARANVPFIEGEDAWYGPNAAVWSAAFVAGLVGCTIRTYGDLAASSNRPWTLYNEWSWYLLGHWPCAYYAAWDSSDIKAVEQASGLKGLIVY